MAPAAHLVLIKGSFFSRRLQLSAKWHFSTQLLLPRW